MAGYGDPHTVRSFDEELTHLNEMIARMGGLAETQLAEALQSILDGDEAKAKRVVEDDHQIDVVHTDVEEFAIRMLALRQPMADDLRAIIQSLKAAATLERIGDNAASCAKRVHVLHESPAVPPLKSAVRMGWLVLDMLKQSVDAYLRRDVERAIAVRNRDSEVDDFYSSLFRELLTYMMEDTRNITPCTHLLFIAKNLERIGDQATNLAEMTYYLVTGKTLKTDRPKNDTSSFTIVEPKHFDG